ncbi:MAG TPA: right-handed parallel beta-helix repeat-containing protein [Candidatus Binatia bacterium]|nr:right-handed parallel beta-helix repeat-containing protein [Candidatus Binatia bacterium]
MNRRRVLLAVTLICGLAAPARATVLMVDDDGLDCPGAPYRHIADAVAAASDGDIIQVCRGTYPEQVVITKRLQLIGVASLGAAPVIAPTALPAQAASLLSGNAIAAGVLVDHVRALIDGVLIDLGSNTLTGCSPVLAGVYVRDAEAVVRNVTVQGAQVPGHADCNSGVGLYVESDGSAPYPRGRVRVLTQRNVFRNYQRAGMVATGPGLILKEKGSEADGSGLDPDNVQIGFQLSNQATGILKGVTATGNATSIPGRTASGILLAGALGATVRHATVTTGQTGIFVIGDRARIKGNTVRDMTDDGMVVFGNTDFLFDNAITNTVAPGITGMFIVGQGDLIRGGSITGVPPVSMPTGIWLYGSTANSDQVSGVSFSNVITQIQGVAGGSRNLGESAAAAFALACTTDADCNDGVLCASHTCNVTTGTCTNIPGCDDGNACTADTCDPVAGCVHTLISCDDGNPCTADLCNPATGCYHQNVADGTACGTGMTCLSGICQ